MVVHVLHTLWTHFPCWYLYLHLLSPKSFFFFSILKFFFVQKNIPNSITFRVLHSTANESLENFFSYHQNVKITFRAFSPFSKAHSRSFHCIAFALCVHNFIDFHHTISREFLHNFNTVFSQYNQQHTFKSVLLIFFTFHLCCFGFGFYCAPLIDWLRFWFLKKKIHYYRHLFPPNKIDTIKEGLMKCKIRIQLPILFPTSN